MSIDWSQLRIINKDQRDSFEALCCVLARNETIENGVEFVQNRAPESGCECYWIRADGSQVGWQAKFFTEELGKSQWHQIDESVTNALSGYPNLREYYICLPKDLTHGDRLRTNRSTSGRKFERDHWETHKAKWERIAADSGRYVKFILWGEAEILLRLQTHPGHHRFWFEKDLFTHQWFEVQFTSTIANVGRRYVPDHDIKVAELENCFTGLCKKPVFISNFREKTKAVKEAFAKMRRVLSNGVSISADELNRMIDEGVKLEAAVDSVYQLLQLTEPINWVEYAEVIDNVENLLRIHFEKVRSEHGAKYESSRKPDITQVEKSSIESEMYRLRKDEECIGSMIDALTQLTEFIESPAATLWTKPVLLLAGEGGTGKTHLLCKMAERQIKAGLPAILLLGSHLHSTDNLLPWFKRSLGQESRLEEDFFEALDMCGQAADQRLLLIIDAINESENPSIWRNELNGFLSRFEKYKWIGIVISVRATPKYRAEFEEIFPILPENLDDQVEVVWHTGFNSVTVEELSLFFASYGLEPPLMPLWHDLYRNPLFLHIMCENARNDGLQAIPTGFAGVSSIFNSYLLHANKSISRKLGLDVADRNVQRAVEALAEKMIEEDKRSVAHQTAKEIVNSFQTGAITSYENSLYTNMISEGLIRRDTVFQWQSNTTEDVVTFTFDRFADHIKVSKILKRYDTKEAFIIAFETKTLFSELQSNDIFSLLSQQTLEALAIQLPEKFDELELTDLQFSDGSKGFVYGVWLKSLLLRDPNRFSSRVDDVLNLFLRQEGKHWVSKVFDVLLRLAPRTDHPLNALRLHRYLYHIPLPHRDSVWSASLHWIWTSSEDNDPSAIHRLIDWCFDDAAKRLDRDTRKLYVMTIAWFLSCTNRTIRDRATKALVSLFKERLDEVHQLLFEPIQVSAEESIPCFLDVDDPYIVERLLAVAFGAATRSMNKSGLGTLVQAIYDKYYAEHRPPSNIMIRDYTLSTINYAIHLGIDFVYEAKNIEPPFESHWSDDVPTWEEMKSKFWTHNTSDEKPSRDGSEIYGSATMGDFGTYIMSIDSGTATSHSFLKYRLAEPLPKLKRELTAEFVKKLTANQLKHYNVWSNLQDVRVLRALLNPEIQRDESPIIFTTAEEVKQCEQLADLYFPKFWKSLGPRKRAEWTSIEEAPEHLQPFNGELMQGWVLRRVLELGWNPELHFDFDRDSRHYADYSREPPRVERIGKKYQWISWYELQGLMADNFWWRQYGEPQAFYYSADVIRRNIDPSYSASRKAIQQSHHWWNSLEYKPLSTEDSEWLENSSDVPDPISLLELTHPNTNKTWLALSRLKTWKEEVPEPRESYYYPHAELLYHIYGYLMKKTDRDRFLAWSKEQFEVGTWMEMGCEIHGMFYGEHPWSESYLALSRARDTSDFEDTSGIEYLYPSHEYIWEGEYDNSGDSRISIALPHRLLCSMLSLKRTKISGEWVNDTGSVIAIDPTVNSDDSSFLLVGREELITALDNSEYDLVWRMRGEKSHFTPDSRVSPARMQRLILGGNIWLAKGKLVSECWNKLE